MNIIRIIPKSNSMEWLIPLCANNTTISCDEFKNSILIPARFLSSKKKANMMPSRSGNTASKAHQYFLLPFIPNQ